MYVLIAFCHKNANAVLIDCDNQSLLHHFQWCDFKIPDKTGYFSIIVQMFYFMSYKAVTHIF